MNPILEFFKNNAIKLLIIIVLILAIVYLLMTDNFTVPPHIDQLHHEQMVPQNKPMELQKPVLNESNESSNIPPNYGKTNQPITKENVSMKPDNIYRIKTGREGIEQEHFVSIYDSNFGGLLGTTLGTTPDSGM